MTVVFDLHVFDPLDLKVLEDHRLVCPRTKRLPKSEQDHRQDVDREARKEVEQGKGEKIGTKRCEHRFASPVGIGHHAGGNFKEVYADLTDGEERPNLQERQAHLAKEENEERVKKTKVLQKSVCSELLIHQVFRDRHVSPLLVNPLSGSLGGF